MMTRLYGLREDQRGVTGLETAIVLIAFVVVASVFAFAVLSTGLVTSERSKSIIVSGLEETSSTLVLRGSVVALSNATTTAVETIRFHLSHASKGAAPVPLMTSGESAALITYIDNDNVFNSVNWTATWLTGSGPVLDPGETVEIAVPLSPLTTPLGPSKAFTIELKPVTGPLVTIARTTPQQLTAVMNLN